MNKKGMLKVDGNRKQEGKEEAELARRNEKSVDRNER